MCCYYYNKHKDNESVVFEFSYVNLKMLIDIYIKFS